jgi:hypothetical protein
MKCDRAIELLATGTAIGRWMARRHAVRCPICAAEAARMARLAHALAAVEPLTPAQRALWTSASTEPRRGEARMRWSRSVRLVATAAVCVLGAVFTFVTFRPSPLKTPIDPPVSRTVNTGKSQRQLSPELNQELDSLTSGLRALSQELVQLSRRAELLDERRDAEALARRTVAMNGP